MNNYLHSTLNGLSLPDQIQQLSLGDDMIKVFFALSNQQIKYFQMSDQSQLQLQEGTP